MLENVSIDIVLATYNGEKFLHEQLESIQKQTFQNWRLLIRDDGSWDNTIAILEEFVENDKRISLIRDNENNLGPCKNFEVLLKHTEAEFIFFSDQDDVWPSNRIEKLIGFLNTLPKGEVVLHPLLLHTELKLIDAGGTIIADSYYTTVKRNPYRKELSRILVRNIVIGCSMLINRNMRDLILPFPENIVMHDYYLAIVAELFGVRHFLPGSFIFYRQHEGNVVGVSLKKTGLFRKLNTFLHLNLNSRLVKNRKQILSISKKFEEKIGKEDVTIIHAYDKLLATKSPLTKLILMLRYHFFADNFVDNLKLIKTYCSINKRYL